ncbi:MAG: transporter substrate-binding domain-containing protein [Erysipelotrichaceae bacterium]|nr:transporter substrate-binding domain-containing protein [Erysipelotrichaceae bacterium]MCI9524491.1 transporter substrate-binding domain-containing protein [Erysipelotrichaceae bacterium]
MKKLFALAFTSLIVLAGCGGSGAKKVLTVLTNSGYPPYEVRMSDGALVGFDIELTEMVAKELGYDEVKWEDIDFDALIGAVNSGKGDMVAAGLSPTPGRAESVEFSEIYYDSKEETANFVLTLKDGDIKKTEDIKGKKVGVQIGTIQESAINDIKDEYQLKTDPRKSIGDMVQEIKTKRIDFVVVEKAIADQFLENNPDLTYFQLEAEGNSTGNCFAFKKGNTELCAQVNEVIKKLEENGELDKLTQKWFSSEKVKELEDEMEKQEAEKDNSESGESAK